MRRFGVAGFVLATALTAGLLTATGCASRPPSAEPQLEIDPVQPSMPAWARDVPASAGAEVADTSGMSSMPWQLAAVANDRKTITVAFVKGDGSCVTHAGHSVEVQGTTIVVGEYSTTSTVGTACPAMLGLGVETIMLPIALDNSVHLAHAPVTGDGALPE
jgi:hypothetical protein